MSLLIWLPLNNNLNNQGLTDITVTNNGATVDNNGKLGKCYSFGTSTSYLTLSNDAMNGCTTECSLSFWLNIISWNTSYATYFQAGLGGTPWNHYIFGVLRVGTASNLCFTISNGSSASNASYTTPDLELNTWYHLTFVYKTGHCLIYVNGVLHQDYTTTIVPNFSGITKTTIGACNSGLNYQTNCKLNDVRIYDHALSPREIEILSRGLVCHYPLNNNSGGQPNLYNFESVARLWKTGSEELIFVDATDDVYGNVLKIIVDSVRIYRGVKNVWKADTNFTVSFLAKASKTAVLKIERGQTDYAPDVTVGTTWKRYSTVISCTATTTGGALGIKTSTAGADIYLTQIKVELGDKATAYCPGINDSHYIPLGYDSTTEYDVSGNGYDGTKSGTLTYSTDTIRNSLCTTFASGSHISTTIAPTGYTNSYTFSWWGKYTNYSGHMMWGFSNGNRLNLYMSSGNFYWNTGDGSNNPFNVSAATYGDGSWHHFAISGDGTTTKLYIDGEFKANAKTYKGVTGTSLYFNGWDSGTSYNFNGSLSDFRLYSTVLSADDIKELYNSVAHIDKNGNIYGYEFNEV